MLYIIYADTRFIHSHVLFCTLLWTYLFLILNPISHAGDTCQRMEFYERFQFELNFAKKLITYTISFFNLMSFGIFANIRLQIHDKTVRSIFKRLTIASYEKQHDWTKSKIKTTISQDALSWHLQNFKWLTLWFRQCLQIYNGDVVGDADEDDKKVLYVSTMKNPESERRNKVLFCIGWEALSILMCSYSTKADYIYVIVVVVARSEYIILSFIKAVMTLPCLSFTYSTRV